MDAATPSPRTLVMSRRRALAMAALGAAMMIGGVVLLARGVPAGWLVIGIFAATTAVILVQVTSPAELLLDDDGLTYVTRFPAGQVGLQWRQCGAFVAARSSVRVATQDAGERPNPYAAKRGTAIPAGFDGLNSTDLAALLNQYRSAALSRP